MEDIYKWLLAEARWYAEGWEEYYIDSLPWPVVDPYDPEHHELGVSG